jgi:IS605 OrfB family transposase
MKRTVVVKLDLDDEQRQKLDQTVQQFKKACNKVSDEGWNEDGLKTYQKYKLQEQVYDELREETDLQANLVIRAISRVSEAIKGCVERLKEGESVSKPVFKSDSIAYDKRTLSVWLNQEKCSISTVEGRIEAGFEIKSESNYYQKYLDEKEWSVRQSTIEKHEYEDRNPYYLHLGLEKEIELEEKFEPKVMGVDLGVDNLAVTSTGKFWSGNELNHQRRKFEEIRGKLQQKGTQSSHRTIQEMTGRENRYYCDTLHRISKNIVEHAKEKGVDVIAFEDLKEIRKDISNEKKFQQWCYRKLYHFVEYKAEEKGIAVKQVSPKYTSQRCSECGHTTKGNRNGSKFKCVNCGKELHSDYNAAKNIGNKFLRSGQKFSGRKGYGQLALKSGTVNLNGNHTAHPATG